jgi:hypothetical protein
VPLDTLRQGIVPMLLTGKFCSYVHYKDLAGLGLRVSV